MVGAALFNTLRSVRNLRLDFYIAFKTQETLTFKCFLSQNQATLVGLANRARFIKLEVIDRPSRENLSLPLSLESPREEMHYAGPSLEVCRGERTLRKFSREHARADSELLGLRWKVLAFFIIVGKN